MDSIKNKGWLLVFILIVGYISIKSVVKEIEVMYHPIQVQYPLTGNGLDTPVAIDTSGSSPIFTSYDHELADKTWWNSNLIATGDRTHNANKKFSLVERLNYWKTKAGVLNPTEFLQDSTAMGLKAGTITIQGFSAPIITLSEGDGRITLNPGASGDLRFSNLQANNDPGYIVGLDNSTGQAYKTLAPYFGVYTPTGSGTNLDGDPSFTEAQYMVIGDVVTVSGSFSADPTSGSTTTEIAFAPPVYDASFDTDTRGGGTAFCATVAGMGAGIHTKSGTNNIVISWISTNTSSKSWDYSFTYKVVH